MSMDFNGINQGNVTISNVVQKTTTALYSAWNAAETTIGTVGAGKKWSIISINIFSGGGVAGDFIIKLNDLIAMQVSGTAALAGFSSVRWDYSACPVLTTGQTIKMDGAAGYAGAGIYILYVEENA